MFDDNQYIEQPTNAPQPAKTDGSGFAQEGPATGAPALPDPAGPKGMDDPDAMDELAKSLEDLDKPALDPMPAQPVDEQVVEVVEEAEPAPAEPAKPVAEEPAAADSMPAVDSELADIKQKALMELSPLVDQLEQAPPERFKTLMMMIQASDNQALIAAAYEAAHGIEDEGARARALLDVVNEINYFTSKGTDQQ